MKNKEHLLDDEEHFRKYGHIISEIKERLEEQWKKEMAEEYEKNIKQ